MGPGHGQGKKKKKRDRYDGGENGNKRGDGASRTVRSHAEFFHFLIDWFGLENGELTIVTRLLLFFGLHYFLWLAGEESREYTIRLAFLAFLFFVGLRFSVSSWLYTQTSFYFLFIYLFFCFVFLFGARASAAPWIGTNSRGQFDVTLYEVPFFFFFIAVGLDLFLTSLSILYYTGVKDNKKPYYLQVKS